MLCPSQQNDSRPNSKRSHIRRSNIKPIALAFSCLVAILPLSSTKQDVFGAENRVDQLVGQLESDDRFSRHRAEAELLKLGDALLPDIVQRLRDGTPERIRLLSPIFDELLGALLDDFEIDVSSLRNAGVALRRLSDVRMTPQSTEEAAAEVAERRASLEDQIQEIEGRIQDHRELLAKLSPMALPTILRRSQFHVSPPDPFEEVLQASLRELPDNVIAPVWTDPAESAARRYELAPFWHWIVERSELWQAALDERLDTSKKTEPAERKPQPADGEDAGSETESEPSTSTPDSATHEVALPKAALELIERARELAPLLKGRLDKHLKLSFQDLLAGDFRRREMAEDTFFLLHKRGVEFLEKNKASDGGQHSEYLAELLKWRVHPRMRERTGMDFRDYPLLGFRERRRFIINYVRAAGRDAVPTLRAIVNDEELEPLNRVKLTAAEALAGLGDLRAIRELNNRRIPELMKIPEISREFFLLQGLKYQEDKQYELAIQEFQKILDESPFHFQANYHIAFAYLLAKNYKKSIHHFVIARRIHPEDMLTLYNLSCAYSLDGQIENALEALEASIKAGFIDHGHIGRDPDLDPLRGEDKFKELLNELRGSENAPPE